jgi:hypothetical protein
MFMYVCVAISRHTIPDDCHEPLSCQQQHQQPISFLQEYGPETCWARVECAEDYDSKGIHRPSVGARADIGRCAL